MLMPPEGSREVAVAEELVTVSGVVLSGELTRAHNRCTLQLFSTCRSV